MHLHFRKIDVDLLCMLLERPSYGYTLSKELPCYPASSIYYRLIRLNQRGILAYTLIPQAKRASRKQYYLTLRGKKVLAEALSHQQNMLEGKMSALNHTKNILTNLVAKLTQA